ncbi:hypothetical protein HFO41_17770 [Rhizobium leguminosarum]|uniref:RipA family octameric membrane protein n=1 Tax=Rhizobium leguminosarum TaxID=384 RepID=UPI001C950753|nr:hypothetical protein [Rhizobium leguminosarum]MBY5690638.1 hypothetical protein [Rhizobium leguminosarum]
MDNEVRMRLDIYNLYLATAEKVSDRRATANTWMLSVNGAIAGLYSYLGGAKASVGATERAWWLWVIPVAGIFISIAWAALLASYRKLNSAKFKVLQELEDELPFKPFLREQVIYKDLGRRPLAWVERLVPISFAALYTALLVIAALAPPTAQ